MSEKRQNDDKYILRFPEGMRDALKGLAKKNARSMNAEVLVALERHLCSQGIQLPDNSTPTSQTPRLDTFVAAALTGLIARAEPGNVFEKALALGTGMMARMEESE